MSEPRGWTLRLNALVINNLNATQKEHFKNRDTEIVEVIDRAAVVETPWWKWKDRAEKLEKELQFYVDKVKFKGDTETISYRSVERTRILLAELKAIL